MRLLLCFSIIVLVSASCVAQDSVAEAATAQSDSPERERIREDVDRLINSAAIRDRAWAAYFVGKHGLKEYAPLIIDLIQQSPKDLRDENYLGCRVFFDSLIQLDVAVSADQLMPLYDTFPNEVIILLAKSPKENQEALLSIAKNANPQQLYPYQYWVAACNLLAQTEARGLAAHLLSEMTLELSIVVTDPNSGVSFGMGVGCTSSCGGGGVPSPPIGFPPIAVYRLVDDARNGRVVVAPGPRTVYYQRTVIGSENGGGLDPGRYQMPWDKDRYVLEYLATLLKTTTDGLQFTNRASRTIHWKNAAEYRQTFQMYKKEIERSYDQVKNRLIERDLLSAAESEVLTPKITVRVFDERQNKTVKLPDL